MKTVLAIAAAAATAALSASAHADYVISFNNLNMVNTTGNPAHILVTPPNYLVGTLTSVMADFIIEAGQVGGVWASDFGVMVTNQGSVATVGNGGVGLYQAGGFNSFGAAEYTNWGTGNSGTAGTPVVADRILANPIVFAGDATNPNVFLAHLWDSNSQGTWSGTITLKGLTVIPTPGALALLGLAGVIGGTRRRRA
jgi:hypothetical protein